MAQTFLKTLAVCAGLAVFGRGFALSYALYTPSDLTTIDLCVEQSYWGGSADYFGYAVIRCNTRDLLEYLSTSEVTFRLTPLPPNRLRYVFEGERVIGVVVLGDQDIEYRLDRDKKCFVSIHGPPGGFVGDCFISPPYRLP